MITQKRGQKVNKHIALVKKWLADPESVTEEELKANTESASAAYAAATTAYAAATAATGATADAAAGAAADAYVYAANAARWVRRYEELTDGK